MPVAKDSPEIVNPIVIDARKIVGGKSTYQGLDSVKDAIKSVQSDRKEGIFPDGSGFWVQGLKEAGVTRTGKTRYKEGFFGIDKNAWGNGVQRALLNIESQGYRLTGLVFVGDEK